MPNMDLSILFKQPAREFDPNLRAYSHNLDINPVHPYNDALDLPAVPVIHPYNPLDGLRGAQVIDDLVIGGKILAFPVTIKLSDPNPEVQAQLGVASLELFITMQSNPWQNIGLLLRPHPWAHRNAPENGNYNQNTPLEVLFAVNDRFVSQGTHSIQTHNENTAEQIVVFSPQNMAIPAEVSADDHTNVFFSALIDRINNRAAISLHVLFNDQDMERSQAAILELFDRPRVTLGLLLEEFVRQGINIPELALFANNIMPIFGAPNPNPNPMQAAGREAFLARQRERQAQAQARLEEQRIGNARREAQRIAALQALNAQAAAQTNLSAYNNAEQTSQQLHNNIRNSRFNL